MLSINEIYSINEEWLNERGVTTTNNGVESPTEESDVETSSLSEKLLKEAEQIFNQAWQRTAILCPPHGYENPFDWCENNRPDLSEFLKMLEEKWGEVIDRLSNGDGLALKQADAVTEALEFCLVLIFKEYREAHGLSLDLLKPWQDRIIKEQELWGVNYSEIDRDYEEFRSTGGSALAWVNKYLRQGEEFAINSTENNSGKTEEEKIEESGDREIIHLKREAASYQASLFPERTEQENGTDTFRSPWADWLDAVQVRVIGDLESWKRAVAEAKEAGVCGLDTETTGLDPHLNRLRLIQLAVPVFSDDVPKDQRHLVKADRKAKTPGKDDWKYPAEGASAVSYVLDLFDLEKKEGSEAVKEVVWLLEELVAGEEAVKIFHNAAFDLSFLRAAVGHRIKVSRLFDTMLASQLCTAGDFIPESQFPSWCEKNGVTVTKSKTGKTLYLDRHGHELKFERDTQKKIRPVYPTHSLQQVAHRHLEVWLEKDDLQDSDWSVADLSEEQIIYAGKDAAVLLPLREILLQLLARNRLLEVAQIEFDCIPAVVEIETSGMPFDAGRAREIQKEASERLGRHRKRLIEIARENGFKAVPKKSQKKRDRLPCDLNPDSSVDVVECLRVLGERERILGGDRFVVGGEEFPIESMDDTLARLSSRLPDGSPMREFIEDLREYRSAKKTYDFTKKWLELLHPRTGRLHPSLRQINPQGVGRFSASNPNLQQAGRDLEIRSLFKVPKGWRLVMADYGMIEMRVGAWFSRDENLLKAFKNGLDVHAYTASLISGKPIDQVLKSERQFAKSLNFGLLFGMTAPTLRTYAEVGYGVSMSLEEAEIAREKFFQIYSGVAAWHKKSKHLLWDNGFKVFWRHVFNQGLYPERRPCIRTLANRLRVWPVVEEYRSGTTQKRKAGAVTEVLNSPVQGGASDLLKLAMGKLYSDLLERGWDDVRIILTVHDELHLECPEKLAEQVKDVLVSAMVGAGEELMPGIPVVAEASIGESWAEKA